MDNVNASTKAHENLSKAFKAKKIDNLTYHTEKDLIDTRLQSVFDDDSTCSRGLCLGTTEVFEFYICNLKNLN